MKKKIVAFLACLLVVATVMPALASFETDAAIPKFGKFKYDNVKTYDTALPKNGAKTTAKKIAAMFNQFSYILPGKGNTPYMYSLSFTRVKKGNYIDASVYQEWYGKNASYIEIRDLVNPAGTDCLIISETKTSQTTYGWKKGAAQGWKITEKKMGGGAGKTPKATLYKLYKDATVAGQKCMVYSYYIKANKTTYYEYVSKKTGWRMKSLAVHDSGLISGFIDFSVKFVSKPSSFFKPPAKVTFTKPAWSGDGYKAPAMRDSVLDHPVWDAL